MQDIKPRSKYQKLGQIQTHSHSKTFSNHSNSQNSHENTLSDEIRKNPKHPLPIPKGETPYALAKQAEYKDRDLDKAEHYYKEAIRQGERLISAIKDLASLMHQRGKTREALDFLSKKRHLFKFDIEKYENLYKTLEKQLNASANSLNKTLKISGIENFSEIDIKNMFENPVRIKSIEFGSEFINKSLVLFSLLRFNSHSSARKTLEGFCMWEKLKVEWVNPQGQVVGDAHYYRQKMEDYRKDHPTFDYQIFERDPHGYVYCLPLDSSPVLNKQNSEQECKAPELLGSHLFSTIFVDKGVECF